MDPETLSLLQGQLEPSEKVLWTERPDWRLVGWYRSGGPAMFLVALAFAALIGAVGFAVSARDEGFRALYGVSDQMALLAPIGVALAACVIALMAVLEFRTARRVRYAITTRRVLVLEERRDLHVIEPDAIKHILCTGEGKSGSLLFNAASSGIVAVMSLLPGGYFLRGLVSKADGLYGLRDAPAVERLIRKKLLAAR